MAQRLNKTLVVALTLAGMAAMMVGGAVLIVLLPARDPQPLLDQGAEFAKKNEYERAATAYISAAEAARKVKADNKHFGKHNEYRMLAGDMALKAGHPGDALKAWSDVLRDDRTNEKAQLRIVDMYLDTYRPFGVAQWAALEKEARALCEMNKDKPNPRGLSALGLALVKQSADKPEKAAEGERYLKQAVAAKPDDPEAAEYLASYYLQAAAQILNGPRVEADYKQADARLADAEKVYDALMANLPKDDKATAALAWRYRGQCYSDVRQLAWYRLKVLQAGRVIAESEEAMKKQFAEADKEALASLQRAVDAGKDAAGKDTDEHCLCALGAYWERKPLLEADPAKAKAELEDNRTKAKEVYRRAIVAAPDEFNAYVQLANLYQADRKLPEAAQVLDERLNRVPQRGRNENYSKHILNSIRKRAFEIRLAQTEQEDKTSPARDGLIKKLGELRTAYVNDVEGGEQSPIAKFMQARLLILDEKLVEALKLTEEANTATAQAEPEINFVLAWLYQRTGAPGRAEAVLREATRKSLANSDAAWNLLARLQLQMGNPDEAMRSAERCVSLNAQNKEALQVMLAVYTQKNDTQAMAKIQAQLGEQVQPGAKSLQEAITLLRQVKPGEAPDAATLKQSVALLHATLADAPTNFRALQILAMILSPKVGDSEEVKAAKVKEIKTAIDAALAAVEKKAAEKPATTPAAGQKAPDYAALATNIRRLNVFTVTAATAEERLKAKAEILAQEPDPFDRAVGLASLYSNDGKTAEAIAQLKKAAEAAAQSKNAEEAKEKAKDVAESIFMLAVAEQALWPDAEEAIKKLQTLGAPDTSIRTHRARLALARAAMAGEAQNSQEVKTQATAAKAELEASLKAFPNDTDACAWMGEACRLLGELDAAQQWSNKALDLNPQNRAALVVLYQVAALRRDEASQAVVVRKLRAVAPDHVLVRRADEAAEDARDPKVGIARREKFASDHPQDVENLLSLADLYARTQQDDKAKATFERCLKAAPKNVSLLVAGSYAAYLREKTPSDSAAAEQVLRQTLTGAADPADKAKAQLMLAGHFEALARRGGSNAPKLAEVVANYEAAAKIKEDPSVLVDIANFYARTRQPREAESKLRQAVTLTDQPEQKELNRLIRQGLIRVLIGSPEDRYGEIEAEIKTYSEKFDDGFGFLAHSELAMATGRVPEAMEDLSAYIRKLPRDATGYYRRGYLFYQRGAVDKAIEDLQKSVEIDPRALSYEPRRLLAQCLAMTKQTDLAIAQLSAILQEDPSAGLVAKQLAGLYADEKQWNQAEALILPRARDLNSPDRLFWMNMLTDMYKQQGDTAKAIRAARETAEAGNYRPDVLDILGDLCIHAGQAREFIDVVTQKAPADIQKLPGIQVRLAEAYAAAKDAPKAFEIYDQLLTASAGNFSPAMAIALSLSHAAPKEGADWLAKRWAAKKDERSLQFALGVFQVQNQDYAGGMKNLNTILAQTTGTDDRSKSERITLLRFMSIAAHTQKDLPTARKLYEELLTLDPQNSTITNNLAYLLMTEFKEPAKAQELAETAVRNLSPTAAAQDKAVLFDTLGWCLVSSGNLDAGIARLQQAASLAQGGNASLDYVMAGLYYHMAEGYFRRSQASGNKNAEFDRTESGVACRRSWHLLKTADPSDPDKIGQSLKDLAGKLKIDLEQAATNPPAKKS